MSFDISASNGLVVSITQSQSLSSRAMSFDQMDEGEVVSFVQSQSLSSRAMSFDITDYNRTFGTKLSQSLSSRAMSFDISQSKWTKVKLCLNPFRAGRCLSTETINNVVNRIEGLNPFRAGRCLSTTAVCWRQESCGLSDPLPNFFGRLRSWLLI